MSGEFMGEWLIDSLLVTTLLMGVILLLRRPVAKLFGPGVAYALWLIPAARLLMPSLEGAAAPASESSQAVRDTVRESILTGVSSPDTILDTASKSVVAAVDLTALGVTVWIGGATLFFIIQMIRYASMRDDLLSEATEIANIDGVSVVASDQVAGPLAFGLFKRFIAVPHDFTKTYSPAERELAIAHEMAHHKSGDLFANLAAFILLCLQWFNPIAWMSWSAFRFDQEAACDARVLAGKGAEERAIYGQALAKTAFDGVPIFATALNSPKTIIERLRRLAMKDASFKRRSLGKLGIIAAGAVILPLTATVVPAVVAQDAAAVPDALPAPAPPAAPKVVKKVTIIKIDRDGKTVNIIGEDGDGKKVRKVERDGKTFVFHTDKELSDAELDKMVENAEESREKADKWADKWAEKWSQKSAKKARIEAEAARIESDAARSEADLMRQQAAAARGHAEAMRIHAIGMAAANPRVNVVRLIPGKVGFPMTESTYLEIRKSTASLTNELELLKLTLGSLSAARENYALGQREMDNRDREILEALDREIRHLKVKINRS